MTQIGLPGVKQAVHSIDGRDPLDRYYTPGLLAWRLAALLPVAGTVVEPNVGGGAFARGVRSAFGLPVHGVDIDAGAQGRADCHSFTQGDWLTSTYTQPWDWAIGNPPFHTAERHVRHSLTQARNVAYLLRLAFLESKERVPFWQEHPARKVWVLAERPSFTDGGTDSCAYGFFWWDRDHTGPTELEVLSWR